MRPTAFLLLLPLVAACGAATGAVGGEHTARQIEANEALAIAHLRSLVGAQIQAQSLLMIDADEDGVGEFAFLPELSGAAKARGPGHGLKLPLLGGGFGKLSESGAIEVHGYYYRSFLPGPEGAPVKEGPAAGADVVADGAETSWLCYAWPVRYGETGRRTFVVGASEVVHGSDLPEFSGLSGPDAAAALTEGNGLDRDFRPEWKELD